MREYTPTMSRPATPYEAGDVVATPDGRGVVLATRIEEFSFPQEDHDHTDVEASPERPAYVVALEGDGSAVYRAPTLELTTFDETQLPETENERLTDIVNEDVDSADRLPEGMDRQKALAYWSSVGGSWKACVNDRADELGEQTAEAQCTAIKDLLSGIERWREHF